MKLPTGLTVAVIGDNGSEVVIRIQGSERYVAENLACAGRLAMLTLPNVPPGEGRHLELIQGQESN
jgi:hypothetical protein